MSYATSSSDTTTSSYDSEYNDDEEREDEEEDDDEMILELREVLHQSTTISLIEETNNDSLDGDDSEEIRSKLRALREYVNDLQASYDELLELFNQLESAARRRISKVENKLSTTLRSAKEFKDHCSNLESQVDHPKRSNSSKDSQLQIEVLEDDLLALLKVINEGVESGIMKLSTLQLSSVESPLLLQDLYLDCIIAIKCLLLEYPNLLHKIRKYY
jgi:hypothetical protein